MSLLDPIELPKPGPTFMVGAVSPLWGYFSAAAMGGVAYWWMTRWTRPMNLEALLGAAWSPAKAAEAVEEATTAVIETVAEALPPLGGEAAPISPLVALAEPSPVVEAVAEPVIEPPTPAPESVVTAPVETATFAEPDPEPAPAPKSRKAAAAPPAPTPDA